MTWLVVRDGFLQHWWFVVAFYSISGSRWLFTALVVRDGFLRHSWFVMAFYGIGGL